jgi:hypothetical protein
VATLFERLGGTEILVTVLVALLLYAGGLHRVRSRILGRRRGP